MQIRIGKELYTAHKNFLKCTFNEREHDMKYFSHVSIDLGDYDATDVSALADELAKTPKLPGARSTVDDVRMWLDVSRNAAMTRQARAKSVKQLYALLVEYFRQSKRKHVYRSYQNGDDRVTFAYYVEEVHFHPRARHRDYVEPEHITVDLCYESFEKVCSKTITFHITNCIGLNIAQALLSLDFYLETATLRERYDSAIERWRKAKDRVGGQCLAAVLADTEGMDGNDGNDDRWYWRQPKAFIMDMHGTPSRVVIDVFRESDKDESRGRDYRPNQYFWRHQKNKTAPEKEMEEIYIFEEGQEEEHSEAAIEIPVHPYVPIFDLKRHKRLRIHIDNLTPYKYNTAIRESLVLPEAHSKLIDTLLVDQDNKYVDVVAGKTGGTIILCQGPPGTGKTLTAEICAEAMQRPLYTIQCSQLGVDPDDLEENLMKVFARGRRWNALVLLDEADVYVHERGNNLQQNAIVGTFLRVLEYHAGTLFLTTNRGDLVDDAILSRCTARIPYAIPTKPNQVRIWRNLAAANGITLDADRVLAITDKHPALSGRDVKNLLKLALLLQKERGCEIDAELISEVRVFKPTNDNATGTPAAH